MRYQRALAIAAAFGCLGMGATAQAKTSHTVSAGDTLWEISRSYGCEVQALRQVNQLGSEHLNVGQTLEIPSCSERRVTVNAKTSEPSVILYQVESGDTLSGIASRYKTSVDEIIIRNDLQDTAILAGAQLRVVPGAEGMALALKPAWKPKSILGQSIGLPYKGKLKKAIRLKKGKGYFIRRPHRSYGATHTVGYLKQSLDKVRRRFPKVHDLAIGDLSARHGGKITMHASHQNGRDVDLGFYFKKRPKGYPQDFVVANSKNINFEASWELLTQFADLADKPYGVDCIFMSYSSQKMFYKLARKHGVSKRKLKKMFQYPAGRGSKNGVIRHEPGHNEHIHVRFKCPPKDKSCH